MAAAVEVPLVGGTANQGFVVRVGDTVRRPRTAPRHLGTDEQGRDVLSYVEGEVAVTPYPAWALTDEAPASVGDLLRRYHRADSAVAAVTAAGATAGSAGADTGDRPE